MLEELSIDESVELVLYHTDREIDEYDFWHDPSEFDENFNIKEQMKEESVIQQCRGLPCYLREVARLCNEGMKLVNLEISKALYRDRDPNAAGARKKDLLVKERRPREEKKR